MPHTYQLRVTVTLRLSRGRCVFLCGWGLCACNESSVIAVLCFYFYTNGSWCRLYVHFYTMDVRDDDVQIHWLLYAFLGPFRGRTPSRILWMLIPCMWTHLANIRAKWVVVVLFRDSRNCSVSLSRWCNQYYFDSIGYSWGILLNEIQQPSLNLITSNRANIKQAPNCWRMNTSRGRYKAVFGCTHTC